MTHVDPAKRLAAIGVVAVTLFAALFARLWYLQVMESSSAQQVAASNTRRTIEVPAPRGRILDRNGKVLVDNRLSTIVTLDRMSMPGTSGGVVTKAEDPERVELLDRLAADITAFMGQATTRQDLEKALETDRYSYIQPVPIVSDIPLEFAVFLSERIDDYGGSLAVQHQSVRRYPFGSLAAHVLGFIGAINDKELKSVSESEKRYNARDQIGKYGVEKAYEKYLRGVPGQQVVEVDRRGNVVRIIEEVDPIPGDDVVLHLDADVQAVAEVSLVTQLDRSKGSRNSDGTYNIAEVGSAVVTDPQTGGVVAMASWPTFNPADFVAGIPDVLYEQLTAPESHMPFVNRSTEGLYAPGSTFKPFTALGGLDAGLITPQYSLQDKGFYEIFGCMRDPARPRGCEAQNAGRKAHGTVDLVRSLVVSSDVYYYELADRMWRQLSPDQTPIQDWARKYGYGEYTGIEIDEGYAPGWMPTPANQKERHDQNPEAFPFFEWRTGDNMNMSIGQGDVLASPLQIANSYAALGNGGVLREPKLAKEIRVGATEEVRLTVESKVRRTIEVPAEWQAAISAGLAGVTTGEGTASAAFSGFPEGFAVAGKTGTSEVADPEKSDNALFVGYVPAERPTYLGVAVLEHSGFGSAHAAPLIRKVLQAAVDPTNRPSVVSLSTPEAVPAFDRATYALVGEIGGAGAQGSAVRD